MVGCNVRSVDNIDGGSIRDLRDEGLSDNSQGLPDERTPRNKNRVKRTKSVAKKQPLESKVQREIMDWLHAKGVYFWRSNNTPIFDVRTKRHRAMPKYSKKGLPDIICIEPGGKILGIEVKRPGSNRLSIYQQEIKAGWESIGARYEVCRCIDDVEKLFSL